MAKTERMAENQQVYKQDQPCTGYVYIVRHGSIETATEFERNEEVSRYPISNKHQERVVISQRMRYTIGCVQEFQIFGLQTMDVN